MWNESMSNISKIVHSGLSDFGLTVCFSVEIWMWIHTDECGILLSASSPVTAKNIKSDQRRALSCRLVQIKLPCRQFGGGVCFTCVLELVSVGREALNKYYPVMRTCSLLQHCVYSCTPVKVSFTWLKTRHVRNVMKVELTCSQINL